ncbi:MAG: hypothetical protein H0S82_05245, partial [Anaerolineaceae bacterium]|nr:hypothetical protein [Anaerolineaceae bacterium]
SISRMLMVSLGSGCLTIIIAGLAAFGGFLIDRQAGTGLRWMLILLIASMPISFGGAYLISRGAVKKMKAEQAALEQQAGDANEGDTPKDEEQE